MDDFLPLGGRWSTKARKCRKCYLIYFGAGGEQKLKQIVVGEGIGGGWMMDGGVISEWIFFLFRFFFPDLVGCHYIICLPLLPKCHCPLSYTNKNYFVFFPAPIRFSYFLGFHWVPP